MSPDVDPAQVDQLANILEAAMLVAGKPMPYAQLEGLFEHEDVKPSREDIRQALQRLRENYEHRGIELAEVASGFRLQARQSMSPWLTHLFQEKSPRYSRALMETLVLIAYRQPITRGEIEDVRGVAVSSNIIKTLLEREWIRVLGHRDVPGRPAILGTTRQFLDYFNLKRIDELPTLSEIKDLDQIDPELAKEVALLEPQAEAAQEDLASNETPEADPALQEADETSETSPQAVAADTVTRSAEETPEASAEFAAAAANGEDTLNTESGRPESSDPAPSVGDDTEHNGTVYEAESPAEAAAPIGEVDLFLGDDDADETAAANGTGLLDPVSDLESDFNQGDYIDPEAGTREQRTLPDLTAEIGESEILH